jgi:adenine-specific DNA-methyltransferase
MIYELYNIDNTKYFTEQKFDLIFCDMIYEDERVDKWIFKYWDMLKENGIFIVMTDFHTDWLVRWYFETNTMLQDAFFVNHLVWKNEWGNHPKRSMHQCYDDIIVYAKGKDYKFDSSKIQVPKATVNKGLNPSGRETKTATAWIEDICLTTTSKERIKKEDGHLIKWQKPNRLMDRVLSPFLEPGDILLEPFGGTFSAVRWAIANNISAVGIEYDQEVYEIGKKEVEKIYDLSIQV